MKTNEWDRSFFIIDLSLEMLLITFERVCLHYRKRRAGFVEGEKAFDIELVAIFRAGRAAVEL